MMPLGVVQQQIVGGTPPVYQPGMMTLDGSSGYYNKTGVTTSGNKVTMVIRFKVTSFTGGGAQVLSRVKMGSYFRCTPFLIASDHATTTRRNKLLFLCQHTTGENRLFLVSSSELADGAEHTAFFSFDGDNGTAVFYVDGVDEDDLTNPERAISVTTLPTGSTEITLGATVTPSNYVDGDIGYFGYDDQYLTNATDFYHPTNGLQELDETTWTEWSSQPLFWNQYGTMTDNKGSAGNMTANGTITGPA